jgi:hypothetical protein
MTNRRGLGSALVLALACGLAATGCAGSARATPSPRPDQPCRGADEQSASAFYPELEALLPAAIQGQTPSQKNSGRYCSSARLGTLYTRDGIHEVHFAGAVWPDQSGTAGLSTVVFRASGLTVDKVADSYAIAADDARNVTRVTTEGTAVGGRRAVRLEVYNQDAVQLAVIWAARQADTIDIVLGSEVDEARVNDAIAALDGS